MEIKIRGIIECKDMETFNEEFIDWLESKEYTFGGGMEKMDEKEDV